MSLFSSVGNAVGGPIEDVIDVAEPFLQQAVPGLAVVNQFLNVDFGSSGGVDSHLRNILMSQQQEDIRKSDRRGRGGNGDGGCQPQRCGGGGGGGSTLEMLAEVLGNMQEERVRGLIDKGQRMAKAEDDELLKLSTQIQTDKLLLDVAMEATKNVINGIGQNAAKPLQT